MANSDPLLPLKKLKHQALVTRKTARRGALKLRDMAYTAYDRKVPYSFDVDRHRNEYGELPRMYFLHRDPPKLPLNYRQADPQLFCLWTGTQPLPKARKDGLQSLREKNTGIDVITVTPENIDRFIVPEHPIPREYYNLSLVHRSDYLRAYLMHHHGGAYSDIKRVNCGFQRALDALNSDPDAWLIGYRERGSDRVGGRDARLGPELRRRFRSLAGAGAFACRPRTPFTAEWLREIERRLAYYSEELAMNPGDTFGRNAGYPIQWIELGMDVMYPLELKYFEHVRFDDSILPELGGHR